MHKRLYPWEAAGLAALCVTLLFGLWAERRQSALADKVIRLHVIAASDSDEDQAEKLRVRDAVLAYLEPRLEGAKDTREVSQRLTEALPELETLAGELTHRPATAALGREDYPTREYGSFSLPAGRYTSLRVTLGEGKGHNWWCVVYPPLCMAAAEEVRETAAMSEDDIKLITEDGGSYVFRFRVIEWWETLTGRNGQTE